MIVPCTMTFTRSSPRAACARCFESIEPEDIIVSSARRDGSSDSVRFLHPACAVDVDTAALCALLRRDSLGFRARSEIESLAFAREQSIAQRALSQWRERHEDTGKSVAIAPARPLEDDPALLRPARDPRGRPRVRVILCGPAVCERNNTSRAFWSLLREGYAWPSPKREYAFVLGGASRVMPDEDPAQPIVGVVYAPLAKKGAKLERAPALWLLAALSPRPPLLWLHGIKSWKARDENILRVREHVSSSGFDADLCPILAAPTINGHALDALVLALDEHFDGVELRATQHQASAVAAALLRAARERLETIDEQRFDKMLAYVYLGRTAGSDAIVTELAEALIERRAQRLAARALATRAITSAAVFERWFANEATLGHREPSWGIAELVDRYAECEGAAPVAQLIELAARSTHPSRTMELVRLFERWVSDATATAAIDALARIESPTLRIEYARLTQSWRLQYALEPRSSA